jgi:hypothetical protein
VSSCPLSQVAIICKWKYFILSGNFTCSPENCPWLMGTIHSQWLWIQRYRGCVTGQGQLCDTVCAPGSVSSQVLTTPLLPWNLTLASSLLFPLLLLSHQSPSSVTHMVPNPCFRVLGFPWEYGKNPGWSPWRETQVYLYNSVNTWLGGRGSPWGGSLLSSVFPTPCLSHPLSW